MSRLYKAPWGAWVDLNRVLALEVIEREDNWYVQVSLSTGAAGWYVWSRPHERECDAQACSDAFIAGIHFDTPAMSPYRH